MRVETAKGMANLECEITDGTGSLVVVFIGRRRIPGIDPGTNLVVVGTVGTWRRRLAILNPTYELLTGVHASKH
jgi:hypothetical protein